MTLYACFTGLLTSLTGTAGLFSCSRLVQLRGACQRPDTRYLVCKIPLLARALGLKAKRARDDRVSCIQQDTLSSRALGLAFNLGRVRARANGKVSCIKSTDVWFILRFPPGQDARRPQNL